MPSRRKFLIFSDARKFIRDLGLKNANDFRQYGRKNRPDFIPSAPNDFYKDDGWISWMDWLGTNNRRRNERKYKVNDNYFKKWSPNMSYILGFWFTDGCTNGKNLFSISQHKNEKDLMLSILKEMRSNYPLRSSLANNNLSFHICSPVIVKNILRLGGKQSKSLDVKFPKVPKKYLPDFIRGLWDGDGYVGNTKTQPSYVSSFSSGSKCFVSSFLSILRKNISGLNGCIKIDIRKKGTKRSDGSVRTKDHICYNIMLFQNDTRRLRDFMYSTTSNLRMDRKYEKFKAAGDICIATKDREYLSFQDAKRYVSKLGINNQEEWQRYSKSKNKPSNIPSNPWLVYKNKGWKNMYDFFGKVRVKNSFSGDTERPKIKTWKQGKFWNYEDAKRYVNSLCLLSKSEWTRYRKFHSMPSYIPSVPDRVYKNKGWLDWKDWLGYEKRRGRGHEWQFSKAII